MFLVNHPSPGLQQTIDQIKAHNFCSPVTDSPELEYGLNGITPEHSAVVEIVV